MAIPIITIDFECKFAGVAVLLFVENYAGELLFYFILFFPPAAATLSDSEVRDSVR